ncbi:methyl-accepting chemotaxis protein [Fundidesulfovibrio terrae]|uniref:methyl-accepting chemotaxis protein n=1 Tax=Fundidesulfovibrio terrae TaxID=2922866 RepID=UPI001FAF98D3|nr:methyl-accepting chemotaxis protein [Fundidesulfovibrio terrae]
MQRKSITLMMVAAAATLVSGVLGLWLGSAQALWTGGMAVGACFAAALAAGIVAAGSAGASDRVEAFLRRVAGGDYKVSLDGGGESALETAARGAVGRLKNDLGFSRGVLMGMATPCVVVDNDEVLRFTNRNLLRILEQDGAPEDYYGQNVAHFFYGDSTRQTVLGVAMRERREITKEVELTGRKGGKRNIRIDASPLYDLDGRLMGSLCVYADLTDLRVQEAVLVGVNQAIARTAEQADASGGQVAQAVQELSGLVSRSRDGAEKQRSRMGETAGAVEEMSVTVTEMAQSASLAADTSGNARRKAQEGAAIVGQVVAGIGDVESQARALKADMDALGRRAAGIGQVLGVISDIADQTNLLALNAAIEAARAGEAGRGFAVVADEVRKLAEKTQNATKEVETAIRGIQEETGKNVDNVDRAVKTIEQATLQAARSGEALSEIVGLIDEASGQVRSIATASERESASADAVRRSVEDVSAISSETAQAMTQASRAVAGLADQAQVLLGLIRRMREDGGGQAALT